MSLTTMTIPDYGRYLTLKWTIPDFEMDSVVWDLGLKIWYEISLYSAIDSTGQV